MTFATLYLLQCLKARFPAAKGFLSPRLFISAFMLALKIICDDTYSNKSWCIVSQGMFALRKINQMEREMCSYLEWQLNIDPTMLCYFQSEVQLDFAGPGSYSAMVLPLPAPAPFSHQTTGNNVNSSMGSSIPAFSSLLYMSWQVWQYRNISHFLTILPVLESSSCVRFNPP
jgi:hypothetical protein